MTRGLETEEEKCVQGVTHQANSSLKQILEQHGITGTPTLLQQLVRLSHKPCKEFPSHSASDEDVLTRASQNVRHSRKHTPCCICPAPL